VKFVGNGGKIFVVVTINWKGSIVIITAKSTFECQNGI